MAGFGTPLGFGEGVFGETFVAGGPSTVIVELDDGTGTFPHDVTGYVLAADVIKFDRGRQDWQGGVTAGSMSLTLNNADGRFTVGSTTIASPSPIKVDQRIRFRETVNGTTYTRFTGYVKQWPVAWPATVGTWATVSLVATDAQARAERRVLKSVIAEEFLPELAHYVLDEPAGSASAVDSSGNQAPPLLPYGSVTFGDAIGALPAVRLDVVGYLLASTPKPYSVACFAFSGQGFDSTFTLCALGKDSDGRGFGVFQLSSSLGLYNLVFYAGGFGAAISSPNTVADGKLHFVEVQYSAGNYTVYLDGASLGSAAGAAPTTLTQVMLMNNALTSGVVHVAHFALYESDTGAARALARATAVLTGFAGESGTARITRTAGYAGIPLGTLDPSLTNVAYADTAGTSAWDEIQNATDAEMGAVFVDADGQLEFHNRNRAAAKTTPDLILSNYDVKPGAQPTQDDQQIVNYVESASATGIVQVARSATSEDEHGRYSESKSYLVQTDAEALDRANWIVANFAEPATRYGTLTVNLYAMTPADAAAALAAIELDAWVQVTGLPSQTPGGTTVDLVVEGYSEEITATSWEITLNVVSKSLSDALILDDPTRGVLDAGNRLYV